MAAFKKPKVLHWTAHCKRKMRFYKLSEQRVRRVLHAPKRIEEGIAPKTVAMMQPASPNWSHEIWVMIQDARNKRKVISAWRYPGRTRTGEPLPEEILRELREAL